MTLTIESPLTAGDPSRPAPGSPPERRSEEPTGTGGDGAAVAEFAESMPAGFLALDSGWRITHVNRAGERILNISSSQLIGQSLWEAYPAVVGTEFEQNYRQAVSSGEPVSFDAYYPAPLDAWYDIVAHPHHDGLWLFFLDISARRSAERLQLLAATSEVSVPA